MPRGGKRQGTPGKGYSNRTDLQLQPDMEKNTAASGGMTAPAPSQPETAGPPVPLRTPDDSISLSAPTQRPDEPITAGMPLGPGAGPESLIGFDPRAEETARMRRWIPVLEPIVKKPDTPVAVKNLYRYIRGF